MALNQRQQKFVEEYLICANATQAATSAGYSEKTAYSIGGRLLKNVEILQAIDNARTERNKRVELTQDMVLDELRLFAFADVKDTAWGKGGLPAKDKLKALELLMRHMGMMRDKVDVAGDIAIKILREIK